ncbi:hypothetical protein [Verrucomicrobium spinosum]|uniref:hypothetical protein n=1 Tax=Verrucomicrobium spinosum TaxID=2736 RepID=UPI0001746398|nr:hypothetical protein [Verrucomicrobium spinosum]
MKTATITDAKGLAEHVEREKRQEELLHQHHEDPVTGEPGSHPLGAGLGATGGAVAGAIAGAIAGPVGSAVGAIVGGVTGGLMGKEVAESLDPQDGVQAIAPEGWEEWWRDAYISEPYLDPSLGFEEYLPAYRLGYETYAWQRGTLFEDIEITLENRWEETRGTSRLPWSVAKEAIKSSWRVLDERGANGFDSPTPATAL